MKNLSIYVHIPFCDSKCYYCNFVSYVSKEHYKYFTALEKEISEFKDSKNYCVKTVYIGGGTPSSVDSLLIENLLKQLRNKFYISEDVEITIESNPNSIDVNKLEKYKSLGINRISFGVQSFNKKSLEFVGRVQEKNQLKKYKKTVVKRLKQAKKVGFNNISVDIILGLPYQKKYQIKRFVKRFAKRVNHFSCYMLSVEEGTKLFDLLPQGVPEDNLHKQYQLTFKTLKKLGFERYEVSNFAKKGFESKHNNNYWLMGEYVGFGVAAHSFLDRVRIANTEDIEKYISYYIDRKQIAETEIKSIEYVSTEQLAEETIMLGLRTKIGLDLSKFRKDFYDLEKKKANVFASLLNIGFIEFENNFLKLSDKGILVSNAIILKIIS